MRIVQEEIRDTETQELLEPRVIECTVCNNYVQLSNSWANDCRNCGVEYNGSGQQLARREHRGHETGERF